MHTDAQPKDSDAHVLVRATKVPVFLSYVEYICTCTYVIISIYYIKRGFAYDIYT